MKYSVSGLVICSLIAWGLLSYESSDMATQGMFVFLGELYILGALVSALILAFQLFTGEEI